jgi:hypothetical protein
VVDLEREVAELERFIAGLEERAGSARVEADPAS